MCAMERNAFIAAEAVLATKGCSVARLCRRADISQSTWHRLRLGETTAARATTVGRLAVAFQEITGQPWPAAAATEAEAA